MNFDTPSVSDLQANLHYLNTVTSVSTVTVKYSSRDLFQVLPNTYKSVRHERKLRKKLEKSMKVLS